MILVFGENTSPFMLDDNEPSAENYRTSSIFFVTRFPDDFLETWRYDYFRRDFVGGNII